MPRMRVILMSSENGEKEGVYVTDDFSAPASDFLPAGMTVVNDEVGEIEGKLLRGFPLDYHLRRTETVFA